jgi:hypothetical protein
VINLNDETGEELYPIVPVLDPETWLGSFETLEEAERYVVENDLCLQAVRDTRCPFCSHVKPELSTFEKRFTRADH